MKKISLALLSVLAAAIAVPCLGQSKASPESPSILYKVTGKGMAKPSYIFGTFHVICPTDMVPLETLDPYISQTDQLIMEIDMDDPAVMGSLQKAALITDGKDLSKLLTLEQFAKVDAMLKNYTGYSADLLKSIKPSMLVVLAITSAKAIGCTPTTYDLALVKNAVAKNKPVFGLETVESQTQVIDSQPLETQAKHLYEMSENPQNVIDEFKKLMNAYKSRDAEKLYDLAKIQTSSEPGFEAKLLDDRNQAWIPKLETAFHEKPTLVAVGAGHLGGPKGVVKLLRAKGYTVTAIKL